MRAASYILLLAFVLCFGAAIWLPAGSWWQWSLTALIVLFAAAFCAHEADKRDGQADT